MARNAVTDWDTTAGNNTDIASVNIGEGCPAAGINDAIRAVMAQIATWLVATTGPLTKAGGTMTGTLGLTNSSTVADSGAVARGVGYRSLPLTSKSASYQIALTDVGQGLSTTAGVTVPTNATVAFAVGDTVSIYNNSGSTVNVTQSTGVTLRLGGATTTGNRTVAVRGLATLLKVGTDEWVISGHVS